MSAPDNKSLAELLSQHATSADTPGGMLRKARLAAGLSEQEVAERLRLLRSQVVAIEHDNYDQLRGSTFARGYLRAYAELIGLSADAVLQHFELFAQRCPDSVPQAPTHQPRGPIQPFHSPAVLRVSWSLAGVVLVSVIAGLWWYHRDARLAIESPHVLEALRKAPQVESPAPTSSTTELQPLPARDAVEQSREAQAAEAATAAPLPTQVETAPAVQAETASVTVPLAVTEGRLEMRFADSCWVEVRDSKDQVLHSGMQRKGDVIQMAGSPPLRIHLGNAQAAQITYNGEPLPVMADPVTKTARVVAGN